MYSIGRPLCAVLLSVILSQTSLSGTQQSGPQQPATSSVSKKFVLDDGTPVKLRLSRNLSSADARTGDNIDFEVLEEVKVGEVVVIPKDNIAIGTITDAEHKKRMARGGKLDTVIDYVKLADGEKAALRAVKETKGGGHTGGMVGGIVATISTCAGPEESATPQQTPANTGAGSASSTTDISDPEKVAVCAGEFMWLTGVAKQIDPKDEAQFERLAFWFEARAADLIGQSKALAISSQTWDFLNDQARKSSMREVIIQEAVGTGQCVPLITRVIPATKSCFGSSINSKLAPSILTWNLKCDIGQQSLDHPSGQTTSQADRIVSRDGRFSLLATPGWGKLDSNSGGGIPRDLARAAGATKNLDMVLGGPLSSSGVPTFYVMHGTVGPHRDLPNSITLEQYQRDMNGEGETGEWTEFRPEPPTHMDIDGHDAIAWQVTKGVNGITLKTFHVSVFVGARVYDFHLQAGSAGDFSALVEDVKQMLRTVKFR